jgi:putative spermidine/putrescine transport system ATP-binding protein
VKPRGLLGHAVALDRVSHYFGYTCALDRVSFKIAPGELVALLGPSGCGKTTLLRAIAGFIRPTSGRILVDGASVNDEPANHRNVGIVFQNYALFPHLTVFENVAYGLRARRTPGAQVRSRVTEMLELVKMGAFAMRLPGQLSGGQQQRIALARALAIEPRIVLLDEPFSALDKNLRLDMQIEIKGLLKTYGLTSIIVTHDQEEALSMADRIVVLNCGRVEQIDTPERLYDQPANVFVNRFVGHSNMLRGRVECAASGSLSVRLETGVALKVHAAEGLAAGSDVILSVRPENVSIVEANAAGAFPAKVHLTLPLGPVEVIEARTTNGRAIKLSRPHKPSTPPVVPGTDVLLAISDPNGVTVFPDNSGQHCKDALRDAGEPRE